MTDDSYVVVFEAQTELDAAICRSLLEEAGIPVVVRPAGEAWLRVSFGQNATPAAQLLVPAERSAEAQDLLAAYRKQVEEGAFELKDDEEG